MNKWVTQLLMTKEMTLAYTRHARPEQIESSRFSGKPMTGN